jgi:methionine aminopeptidase
MILLKSPQEIAKMEVANRIVAEVLEEVKSQDPSRVKPGNWMNWRKRCAASIR